MQAVARSLDTSAADAGTATPALVRVAEPRSSRIELLVAHQYGFLTRSLRNLGVAEAEVEDVAQQVLIIVNGKLDRVRLEAERAFLFQTAVRLASRHHRTRRRRREVADEVGGVQLVSEEAEPDVALEQRRLRNKLDRLLAELPMECRSVLVLFEIEELSLPEIAELVSAPLGTVKTRLRRGRQLLLARVQAEADPRRISP